MRIVIDFTRVSSRLALLLVQFLILIMCVGYMEYTYTVNILPDKAVKENFTQVDCYLMTKRLSTAGHVIHGYRADFLISYNVGGTQYNRWVSGNGLDASFTSNLNEQEDLLTQYEVGATYPCYYDPNNPQLAILVLRHNWLSTFPLMIPSVVALIVFYYFLKNLFFLLALARTTARNRKAK
jgi:hypothetical protein